MKFLHESFIEFCKEPILTNKKIASYATKLNADRLWEKKSKIDRKNFVICYTTNKKITSNGKCPDWAVSPFTCFNLPALKIVIGHGVLFTVLFIELWDFLPRRDCCFETIPYP